MANAPKWPLVELRDHIELLTGFPFKSAEYTAADEDVRLLRGDNIAQGTLRWENAKRLPKTISNDYPKFELSKDDVILAMDRPWIEAGLKYAWITMGDLPCLLVQRVARLRGKTGLTTKFLRYVIGSHDFTSHVKSITIGVNVPHISGRDIGRFQFCLPPLQMQERIASILSAYDDLIENNTRRIAILEEMARRIFEEWFIHFHAPGCEGLPHIDSAIGSIPQGWRVLEVKNIIQRKRPGVIYRGEDCQSTGPVMVIDQSTDECLGFHDKEPDHAASAHDPLIIFGDHTCKMQMMLSPFSIGQNTIVFGSCPGLSVHYVYALIRRLSLAHEYKRHWNDLLKKLVLAAPLRLTADYGNLVRPLFEFSDNLRQ
jgi:restriction endonuclease S subunit